MPWVWKAAGILGSSLRQSLNFWELFFIPCSVNWEFALFRERVRSVFGNRSCFSGKGNNYSEKARLLTLCPGTVLGRRDKKSCPQRLPRSARFCQSPNCCRPELGWPRQSGGQLFHVLWDGAYLSFNYPTRTFLRRPTTQIYKHPPT